MSLGNESQQNMPSKNINEAKACYNRFCSLVELALERQSAYVRKPNRLCVQCGRSIQSCAMSTQESHSAMLCTIDLADTREPMMMIEVVGLPVIN